MTPTEHSVEKAPCEHKHEGPIAAMDWRDLVACLERGCGYWPTKTVTTALFFALLGMESELRELRRRDGDDARQLARVVRALIVLAPANSKRKTVATADVQAIWTEARRMSAQSLVDMPIEQRDAMVAQAWEFLSERGYTITAPGVAFPPGQES